MSGVELGEAFCGVWASLVRPRLDRGVSNLGRVDRVCIEMDGKKISRRLVSALDIESRSNVIRIGMLFWRSNIENSIVKGYLFNELPLFAPVTLPKLAFDCVLGSFVSPLLEVVYGIYAKRNIRTTLKISASFI